MRHYRWLAALVLSLAAVCAFAHGDKVHVRGTVTGVSDSSITVKAPDGKAVDVKLVKSTIYTLHSVSADQPAKASDLAVGDMVVVHATPAPDGSLSADEIRFSVPAKTAPK